MKTGKILNEVLKDIELNKEESLEIKKEVNLFLDLIKNRISKLKYKPEVFVGGSYAKNTMIKKKKYDVDVFLRYDKMNSNEDLSKKTAAILKDIKEVSVVHGSRDYFRIKINEALYIEIVPVIKVSSPKDSKNITDLSYSHVKYINKKIKNKKILDDIKIAKAFCYANGFYGAESYIKGFSGYSLELLVYHYKGFINMIKELSKNTVKEGDKIIIDMEKKYRNKKEVLLDMNSSKLGSPIILVDPTYEQRNALAALSEESFGRFKKVCKEFLRGPSAKYFEEEKINLIKLKKDSLKKKHEFILIETKTKKQEGDVAGSKLLKFYNHLGEEMIRFFDIKDRGFNYNGKQSARYFFVVKKKDFVIYRGPSVKDAKNVKKFKKEHKVVKVNKGNLFSNEKVNFNIYEFIKKWSVKNKRKIKEMSIENIKVIDV